MFFAVIIMVNITSKIIDYLLIVSSMDYEQLPLPFYIHISFHLQSKYDELRKADKKSKAGDAAKLQRYTEAWNLVLDPVAEELRPLMPKKVHTNATKWTSVLGVLKC